MNGIARSLSCYDVASLWCVYVCACHVATSGEAQSPIIHRFAFESQVSAATPNPTAAVCLSS